MRMRQNCTEQVGVCPGVASGDSGLEARWEMIKGTGKFEIVQGKGTSQVYFPAEGQGYMDRQLEVELPRWKMPEGELALATIKFPS